MLYLRRRFYLLMVATILVIAAGAAVPTLYTIGRLMFVMLLLAACADTALLWSRRGIVAERLMSDRFSNGDENPVRIHLESTYPFAVSLQVVDEIPFVFQRRDVSFAVRLGKQADAYVRYALTPTKRGVYGFGFIRVFTATSLGLVERRFTCGMPRDVKVYPSYLMLRQYELLAMSSQLTEMGIKRIRRIGHNTDFEQIKNYVQGDDYRVINWRATARRHELMVNVYQEERSQQVYSIIDKGRMMQQSFTTDGAARAAASATAEPQQSMTLLDYAINASLVLSFVAVNKQDRAGLITFSDHFDTFLPASRQGGSMHTMQEMLYAEQTDFRESDFSALLTGITRHVSHRSLLVLFTSFPSMTALRRQLGYLRQIGQRHRLLVVFFEDDELRQKLSTKPRTTEDYYQHVVTEGFLHEQHLVVRTLRQYGIQSLLTSPRHLSVGVINKYLEIKSRL